MIDEVKQNSMKTLLPLSLQRALLGMITQNIRAVYADWNDLQVVLYFFFDGEFTEDEAEEVSCIETEVLADILDIDQSIRSKTQCIRLDYPGLINCSGICVYGRKEPT